MATSINTSNQNIISQGDNTLNRNHLGDKVSIDRLVLKTNYGESIGLIGKFDEIIIYENMFSSSISGYITIKDTYGLLEKYLLIGGEQLEVRLTKPQTSDIIMWRDDLIIHRISKSTVDENLNSRYALHFTTQSFIKSFKKRIFKSYRRISVLRIVESLFKEMSVNDLIKEDPGMTFGSKKPYICHGLNPHSAIDYLAKLASTKGKFFLFFETAIPSIGTFLESNENNFFSDAPDTGSSFSASHYFGSIENLSAAAPYTVIYRPSLTGSIEKSLGSRTLRTPSFTRLTNYNHLDAMMTGVYNSKITSIDPILATWNYTKMSYAHRAGPFASYKDKEYELPGEKLLMVTTVNQFGKDGWLGNHLRGQIVNNLMKVAILLEGGTNTVKTGSMIDLKIPSQYKKVINPQESKIDDDILYSGKYIVTAIKHIISSDNYVKEVELSRGILNFDFRGTGEGAIVNESIPDLINKKPTDDLPAVEITVKYQDAVDEVIGTIDQTFNDVAITITRNSDGTLTQKSQAIIAALGIELIDPLTFSERSIKLLNSSLNKDEFDEANTAIITMYPGNVKTLNPDKLLILKQSLGR
jgi:hypothetical protein